MSVRILVASQTGDGFELADNLSTVLQRHHFRPLISDIKNINFSSFVSDCFRSPILFLISTCGQGEFPTKSNSFWNELLKKSLSPFCLDKLQFSCFGLGDSSYEHFNHAVRKMRIRLKQIGAKEFSEMVLGDQQKEFGYYEDFENWSEKVLVKLKKINKITKKPFAKTHSFPPKYKIEILKNNPNQTDRIKKTNRSIYLNDKVLLTHPEHFQKVYKFSFGLNDKNGLKNCESGDILSISPENSDESVLKLMKMTDLKDDDVLRLTLNDFNNDTEEKPPDKILANSNFGCFRAFDLLKRFLDINGTPKLQFFEKMALFSKSPMEKEKLNFFTSKEGQEDLMAFCRRENRTFVETLECFPLSVPPLERLIESIPLIKQRQFSISSISDGINGSIEITVALVEYVTPYGRNKIGLCSEFLQNLKKGEKLKNYELQKGSFYKGDKWTETPIIGIGPGTGLAPLKTIIEERLKLHENDKKVGKIALFLGHREEKRDFLYNWEFWRKFKGILSHFSVAFSRREKEKHYVTHDIIKHRREVWNLIQTGAIILICGKSGAMPKDVKESICSVMRSEGKMNDKESKDYLYEMTRQRRLQMEVW